MRATSATTNVYHVAMSDQLKTVRVTTMMTPSEVQAIDNWAFAQRIRSRGEAIRKLIKKALADSISPSIVAAAAIIAGATLSGCVTSVTQPVTVVPNNGEEPLHGSLTATLDGGKFGIANSKIQCSGEYPNSPGERAVTVNARCSDGRTGTGTAVRTGAQGGAGGGSGTMRMSDGTEAVFAYGSETLSMRAAASKPPLLFVPPRDAVAAKQPTAKEARDRRVWECREEQMAEAGVTWGGKEDADDPRTQGRQRGPKCAQLEPVEQLAADMGNATNVPYWWRQRENLQAAERSKRQAVAKPLFEKALRAWGDCLRSAAVALASTSAEPAETVVRAAFGACAREEGEFVERRSEAEGRSTDTQNIKNVIEPRLLAEIMANRAAGAASRQRDRPTIRPLIDYHSM
jgi:hypothetical protein